MQRSRELIWKVMGVGAGALSAVLVRNLLQGTWRRFRGTDPPANPASPDTRWTEAIVWATASGVAIGVARLVAQRGAAEAWRKKTGEYPPGLNTVTP